MPLATVDDRLAAVQEGRVDASLGAISFHPSRTLRIDFIYPGVYVAGATLFAPGGRLEGVGAWTDLAGVRVAALRGEPAAAGGGGRERRGPQAGAGE